jgi:N-acetylglucosamine kinase-like BadF-type ATPase
LAGADWPEDFAFLESSLKHHAPKVTVFNDAIGAIIAGAPEGWGASVVCGTGGTSGARSPEGKTWHGGFWHDSSCGAETLGQAALAAVLRAELKIDPPTRLADLLSGHYGQASVEEMLHAHTRRVNRISRNAAGLARLVLDAAAEEDAAAVAIVQTQAASAAEHVIVAAREVGILDRPFPLVLAGGVFRHPSHLLAQTLLEHVHRKAPQARAIRTDIEPVAGALLAAVQLGGERMTADLRRRLHETHPPQSLFET